MRVSSLLAVGLLVLLSLSLSVTSAERHDRLRLRLGSVAAPDPRYVDHVADLWIARAAVVAFNESVSAQHKEDWLNSLLYSQLACRTFSGFTQLFNWIGCVDDKLRSLTWATNKAESPRALARADVEQPLAEDVLSKVNGKQSGFAFPTSWQPLARGLQRLPQRLHQRHSQLLPPLPRLRDAQRRSNRLDLRQPGRHHQPVLPAAVGHLP
jgi:hypothetical protein